MQEIQLTVAEKFILTRRREKISRKDFAKRHKLTEYRVNKIEKGLSRSKKFDVLIKPKDCEIAYILRKRAKLKVSKQTILNREAGRRSAFHNIVVLNKLLNGKASNGKS